MNAIEIVIILLILGIISLFAIPSWHTIQHNHTLRQVSREYLSLFKYAHQQAILKDEKLVLCGSSDQNTCDGNWQQGAVLFINEDGQLRPTAQTRLKTLDALPQPLTITVSSFPNQAYFSFDPDGLLGVSNGSVTISNAIRSMKFTISRTGRIRKD